MVMLVVLVACDPGLLIALVALVEAELALLTAVFAIATV
jgi:hypothetical protein